MLFAGPALALHHSRGRLYVGRGSRVQVLDLGTNEVHFHENRLPAGFAVHGIAEAGRVVYGQRWFRVQGQAPVMLHDAMLAVQTSKGKALLGLSGGQVFATSLSEVEPRLIRLHAGATTRQYLCLALANSWKQRQRQVMVAGGSVLGGLLVWDEHSISTLEGHNGAIFSLQFSDDDKHLCSGGEDRSVRVWRRAPSGILQYDQVWCSYESLSRVWRVDWWSEGVVSTGEDGFMRLWSMDGEYLGDVEATSNLRACIVANDICFASGSSGRIHTLDLTAFRYSSRDLSRLNDDGSNDVVSALCYEAQSVLAVTTNWNLLIHQFNGGSRNYDLVQLIQPTKGDISKSILYMGHDKGIIIGSSRGRVLQIAYNAEAHSYALIHEYAYHLREVCVLAINQAAVRLLSASGDGCLRFTAVHSHGGNANVITSLETRLPTKRSSPTCALGHGESEFVIGDSFGSVFIFDAFTGAIIRKFIHTHGMLPVTQIHPNIRGGFVTSGRNGRLCEFADGRFCTNELTKAGSLTQLEAFEVDAEGSPLILGTIGESWRIFDGLREEISLRIPMTLKAPVAFSKSRGVFSSGRGCILHHQVTTVIRYVLPQVLDKFCGHSKVIWGVTCIGHGKYVTASEDETLRLWDTQGCKAVMDSPQNAVRAVCCGRLKGSQVVLAVGASGFIQCWDLQSVQTRLLADWRPDESETRLLCVASSPTCEGWFFVGSSEGIIIPCKISEGSATENHGKMELDDLSETDETSKKTKAKRKLPSGKKLRPKLNTECSVEEKPGFGDGLRAILTISVVSLNSEEFVVCGRTDGRLQIWQNPLLRPQLASDSRVHCAGITAIATKSMPEGILIATGSDDQSVVITKFTQGSSGAVSETLRRFENLVAAAITGLAYLNQGYLIALSNDQRLSVLDPCHQSQKEALIRQLVVDVSDANDLAVDEAGGVVVVVGMGIQLVSIQDLTNK